MDTTHDDTTRIEDGHVEEGHVETIVIGAGQAGLSMGYHLQQLGRTFLILDAHQRVGEAWRRRWDSLRLFTPARYDGLDGMPFPAPPTTFPTKDEMADYLEAYAERFALPIRLGTVVDHVGHIDGRYVVRAGRHRWTADNVVVAMSGFQRPHVPAFAEQLDERIVQVHSAAYRAPDQVGTGTVLVVGAGNSGSEVCMDLARAADGPRRIVLSGRDTGHIPFRIESPFGRTVGVRFVLRFVFRRILSVNSPVGRRKRPEILSSGGPLIRVRNHELAAAGVERAPRVDGVVDGRPRLTDGRILDVDGIVWCTGFEPVFPWIDLPVHGDHEPRHTSGVADDQPGLYFLGLLFLHTMASEMIHGVGADAARLARHLDQRMRSLAVDDRRVAATA